MNRFLFLIWIVFVALTRCARGQIPAGLGWFSIPNTTINAVCAGSHGFPTILGTLGCPGITDAWNSAALDTTRNRLIITGGGHNDYWGNELYALNLSSLTLTRLNNPTLPGANDSIYAPSNCPQTLASGTAPNSAHTYDGVEYMRNVDRLFTFGGALSTCGGVSNKTWTYSFASNQWEAHSPSGPIPTGGTGLGDLTAYDPNSGLVFVHTQSNLYTWNFSTDAYALRTNNSTQIDIHLTGEIDPVNKKFIAIGAGEAWIYDISGGASGTFVRQALVTTGGSTIVASPSPGLAFDSAQGKMVAWNGGNTVYVLTMTGAASGTWAAQTFTGGPSATASGHGTFGRFAYSAASNVFVTYNDTSANGVALRLTGGSGVPSTPNTVTITSTSGSTQTNRPVSVARAFLQGEITQFAQANVAGTPVTTQCDVKNRWPDGSLKFAIVSFVVPSLTTAPITVYFVNQTTGNNTGAATQSDMLAAGYDFGGTINMTGAAARTANARTMLNAGAWRYWLQGPIVTAVIIEDRTTARTYDLDFGDTSKALHPIFEAWFYPGLANADLSYTIENCWTSSTTLNSMRDLSYSLSLSSGNTSPAVRYTESTFSHIGATRWIKRFWVKTDPATIRINHNLAYLVTTAAIPHYDTTVVPVEALIASHYSSWTSAAKNIAGNANGIGSFQKALAASGQSEWIGLMPTWETMYLMTFDDRMLEKFIGNAELSGRIPWLFREADNNAGTGDFFDAASTITTFGRPVSINARKTLTLQPENFNADCGGASSGDIASFGAKSTDGWDLFRDHWPSLGYLPYLMTGRYYFMELLELQGGYDFAYKLGCVDASLSYVRQGASGYFKDSQQRGTAWAYRTAAYAAFIGPDATPEQAYFIDKLQNNIALDEGARNLTNSNAAKLTHWNFGHNNGIPAQGVSPIHIFTTNPFDTGYIQPPLLENGTLAGAQSPWEEGFYAVSFGMARQFGFQTSNLLQFMTKIRVHLLLDATANKYTIESYRWPASLTSTGTWIQDNSWAAWNAAWVPPAPSAFTHDPNNVDHGYGFIQLAAMSFFTPYTVDGFSGQSAYNSYFSQKTGKALYATVSPKWAITPIATSQAGSPPSAPTNLRKVN